MEGPCGGSGIQGASDSNLWRTGKPGVHLCGSCSDQVNGMGLKPEDSIYFQIPKDGFVKYPKDEVRENGIA